MPAEWFNALESVLRRLKTLSEADPALRDDLRALARATLSLAGEASPSAPAAEGVAPPESTPPSPPEPIRPAAVRPLPPGPEPVRVPLPPLTLGRSLNGGSPPIEAPASYSDGRTAAPRGWAPITDADLPFIEQRCRLKAEGTRWAVERQGLIRDGADLRLELEPRDREIIDRAKSLPDCFLWMNYQGGPAPEAPELMENLAGCFETLAHAVQVVRGIIEDADVPRHTFELALDLAAEAQSALRAAVNDVGVNTDSDQQKVFTWLKVTTGREAIYIRRHMRVDDPADPRSWSGIAARIDALEAEWQQGRQRDRQHQSRMKRVQYHLKRIGGEGGEYDWQKIVETIEEMVQEGLPPSNRELRELLLPAIEQAPDLGEPPPGFRLVLREIDRFISNRPPAAAEAECAAERSAEVREAARLLQGTAAVLIGGEPRGYAQQALKNALGLSELIWAESKEHQSLAFFEPIVARPDVSLVLLAIRWSSHSFGEVKQFCDQYGKLLVRLPGGYSPNQVAAQVMSQCSSRLIGR